MSSETLSQEEIDALWCVRGDDRGCARLRRRPAARRGHDRAAQRRGCLRTGEVRRDARADLPVAVLINRCEPGDAARLFGMVAAGAGQYLGRSVVPAGAIPEDAALRDAADEGLSPALSTGHAAHAAGLLAELLLNAASARSERPPLLRTA